MTTTIAAPPPAPPPPPPPEPVERRPVQAQVAIACFATSAVLIDLTLTTVLDGWAALVAVVVVAAGLVGAGFVANPEARRVVVAAVLPAVFLPLRASPWLIVPDVLAVLGLLALGACLARGGRVFDLRFASFVPFGLLSAALVCAAPVVVVEEVAGAVPRSDGGNRVRSGAALVRGLVLAAPVVIVVALVLASGDAVFASFLRLDGLGSFLSEHAVGPILGIWLAATYFGLARRARPPASKPPRAMLGILEASVVLAGLIAVYALFAVARLVVALRGDAYVQETTGLTYAEYARSGFFQLLGAAVLTVAVLLALRSFTDVSTAGRTWVFAVLSLLAVALTLVMVHSAIVRLGLYDAAYGLTMLRLYSTIFAWWIALVLVFVGLALGGVLAGRSWLPGAIACSALAFLLAVNVMNPERIVIERNVARAEEMVAQGRRSGVERFDIRHAVDQSSDAVPSLVAALPAMPEETRAATVADLCREHGRRGDASWNLSDRAAAEALSRVCP